MISIIIPFYNTGNYIEECLRSIESQTFTDYECLLIDDGSIDNSRSIVQRYVDKDNRFILLNEKHIGYPLCKNLGLDNAKGDYICFIDSDDYVEDNYLEKLYNAIIETDSDIANCNHDLIDKRDNSGYEIVSDTETIIRKYFRNTYPWCKLFKKTLFEGLRYRDVEALSDTLIGHLIFERAKRTVYIKDSLYHYRIHNESITYNVRNKSLSYWPFRLNVYIEVLSYIKDKYPKLDRVVTSIMWYQFNFCKPHLTQDQLLEFKQNNNLNNLLKYSIIK